MRASMKDVLRTGDVVLLSAIQAELAAQGIESVAMDEFISAIHGGIGVLPRRLMVEDEDAPRAERIIAAFKEDHGV